MRPRELVRASAIGLCLAAGALAACSGWDPRSPFEHNAPEVDEALKQLDSGRVQPAEETLERYLGTGRCAADAGIGFPPSARQKPSGAFDLGLTLFGLGEQFGQRFGDEERSDGGSPREQALAKQREVEIDCALLVVRAIAGDPNVPADLRARARYLAGNLEFLRQKYEDAVKEYDQALAIVPGLPPDAGGDGIGRDAAWNRAIALRRLEDQKDAGADAPDANDQPDANDGGSDDAGKDGGNDGGGDAGKDGGGDQGDGGKDGGANDAGKDSGGDDGGGKQEPPPPAPTASQSATPQQDERLLEQLELAPSYESEHAKKKAAARPRRPTMEDK